MPTTEQLQSQNLYAGILFEIKSRIEAIDHCTLGRSGLAPPFVKDFCFLQLRMICELVALGCLVAHGDISSSQKLQKAWSADEIMRALEALHPHFYPFPIQKQRTEHGFHIQARESALPKSNFLTLYGKCGNMLHRGNVKKLLKGQIPIQINYPEITAHAQSFVDLLSDHLIVTKSGRLMFLAMLSSKDSNGAPQVAIAESPEGANIDYASPTFLRAG